MALSHAINPHMFSFMFDFVFCIYYNLLGQIIKCNYMNITDGLINETFVDCFFFLCLFIALHSAKHCWH